MVSSYIFFCLIALMHTACYESLRVHFSFYIHSLTHLTKIADLLFIIFDVIEHVLLNLLTNRFSANLCNLSSGMSY